MHPSTFIYENGLPVAYVCRHGNIYSNCTGEFCAAVGEEMLRWNRSMPGQARVRIGKRDRMLDPSAEPIYRRLLNE